ncbi:MAG: hypothetical protein H6510_17810 [Acidobacteria bacterium]|nr:hypothetical protein [Acidobacteriota bacterium]MCB9399673.1 hypothetical protein [Acidobacteriota bacterium]
MTWICWAGIYLFQHTVLETNSFVALSHGQAVLLENGDLVVLDKDTPRLDFYGSNGRKKKSIGEKGEGPGEFMRPQFLYATADRLYLRHDGVKCSIFTHEGTFLSQEINHDFFKPGHYLENRWLLLKWDAPEFELVLRQKEQGKWFEKSLIRGEFPVETPSGKGPVFDPTNPGPFLVPAGEEVFLVGAGYPVKAWKVQMMDGSMKPLPGPDLEPVPFNADWGQEQINQVNKGHTLPGTQYFTPKYFPPIRRIWKVPGDQLVLQLWTGFPETQQRFVCWQFGPGPKISFEAERMTRVVCWSEGEVVFCAFDPEADEPAKLIRTTWSQFDKLCQQYPFKSEPQKHFIKF